MHLRRRRHACYACRRLVAFVGEAVSGRHSRPGIVCAVGGAVHKIAEGVIVDAVGIGAEL
jgi:hypothetical protein